MPGPPDPVQALGMASAGLGQQEAMIKDAATSALAALMQRLAQAPSPLGQAAVTEPGPLVASDANTSPTGYQ